MRKTTKYKLITQDGYTRVASAGWAKLAEWAAASVAESVASAEREGNKMIINEKKICIKNSEDIATVIKTILSKESERIRSFLFCAVRHPVI